MKKLSSAQLETFREHGVIVAEGILSDADLQPVIDEISEHLDRKARDLQAKGKIKDLCEGQSFERRYLELYKQSPEIGGGLDIMFMKGPRMFEFLRNPNLMDLAEDLLGPEITCNPIQHLRAKLPNDVFGEKVSYFNNVPWHQDGGVTLPEADNSDIITFWIPLVNATGKNGCMEVMPDAWRLGQLDHQSAGGTTIVPEQMPTLPPKLAPCKKGGVVLMNKFTPHRGTDNTSDGIRWTLDLRYQPTGQPTGRPFHPNFVTRSRSNPASVLTDHARWCQIWVEGLEAGKGKQMHRLVR